MHLAFNVLIVESWCIDVGKILVHLLFLIIVLHDVAVQARYDQRYLFWLQSSRQQSLYATVSMQSLAVYDTVLRSQLIGKKIHESATLP